MRVARSLEEAAEFGPTAVTIGNFDGVHAGHLKLLHSVVEAAAAKNLVPAVLTFDPHPAMVVAPHRPVSLLSTHAERCAIMARRGIECVLILPFTHDVSHWSPEQFVQRVLVKALHAKVVIVGENFRFGHKQAGDISALEQLGRRFDFDTCFLKAVTSRGRIVSSSEVRRAIEAGRVSLAARLLRRPYALEGEIVRGRGIGSKELVPTLNLQTTAQVLPRVGIYITRTTDLDRECRRWNSVTSVGYRPTFGPSELTIETYLLDPLERPTPEHIRVEFLRWIRDERKFESVTELKDAILRDVDRANAFFRRVKKWAPAALR